MTKFVFCPELIRLYTQNSAPVIELLALGYIDVMPSHLDARLTEAQRQAVHQIQGPLLILAGPGSGKTLVVTHRIAHMLAESIPAEQIVALTFTNKAAEEMRARVERLVPDQPVWLGTFHRFCAQLLRRYAQFVGLDPGYTIYDTADSKNALQHVLEANRFELEIFTPGQIINEISWAKNNLITPADYEPRVGKPLTYVVAEVYEAYQKQLLQSSAVDFDDLLLHVASLLRENAEVRRQLDERFRYILIDEYQDTNLAQYAILRALSFDHPNLAATGDPDQSIFGWRGANLNNILEFEKDFPGVRVVRLEQNYRSTKQILRVADALIANNVLRKHKTIFTENGEGRAVRVVCYPTAKDEAENIAAYIANQVAQGRRRPSDFAVFYRTNALSRTFESAFAEFGVPYILVKGVEFYQRKEIKAVLAYLQLLNNPRDDVALLRVINTPPRGIGKKSLARLTEFAHARGIPLLEAAVDAKAIDGMPKRAAAAMQTFAETVQDLSAKATGTIEHLLGLVLTGSGYREHLLASEAEADEERLGNVEELLTVARQFDGRHPDEPGLEAFLEETALVNDTDAWSEQVERVPLMTLHSAKGLEFPVVFITAVEDKLLPHERSREDPASLEEERRLFFVGITRAKEELQISLAHRRDFRGRRRFTVPSPFLTELPRDEIEVVDLGWPAPQEDESYAESEFEATEHAVEEYDEAPPDEPSAISDPQGSAASTKTSPPPGTADPLATLTTAAELSAISASDKSDASAKARKTDVEAFQIGMAVTHPDYGLGKIAALSGNGPKRTATVNFVTSGQRTFRIQHSDLRPAAAQ